MGWSVPIKKLLTEEKIRVLKKMKAALSKLVSSCKEGEQQDGYPILEYLNEQGKL